MAVVIEALARSIGTSFGCVSGKHQSCLHRVRRQIMVAYSPRIGRASNHYLSSGGNHKTKAVGRNSESKRLILSTRLVLFGWLCDSRWLVIEKRSNFSRRAKPTVLDNLACV